MNLNFDYRSFQKESMEQLAKIYAEAMIEQEIQEDCSSTYEKMQKILKCKEMEKCHPYLFTIDRQCINENDRKKIDELFECGVKRGFLAEEDSDEFTDEYSEYDEPNDCDDALCGGPSDTLTGQEMTTSPTPEVNKNPTFTVLYSAMKNGDVKMGEFYSLKSDEKTAKQDCIEQMTVAGYNNIEIMAIEQNINAVDTDIEEMPSEDLYESLYEDDSEEFEKQETGDISDDISNDSTSDNNAEVIEPSDDTSETPSTEEPTDDEATGSEEVETEPNDTNDVEDDSEKSEEDSVDDTNDVEDTDEPKKELSSAEKTALKDEYTKFFKDLLKKSDMEKSVSEMTLDEKISFLTKISEKWKKLDPSEFLSQKDQEKLNEYVPEKEEDDAK